MSEDLPEPNEPAMPEDVAKLYSRARVPGKHYWDFSASRKEVQEQFRNRIEREHANRAGVTPPATSRGDVMEQRSKEQFEPGFEAGQFQSGVGVEREIPVRNGPAPAVEVPLLTPDDSQKTRDRSEVPVSATPPAAVTGPAQPPVEQETPRWFALQAVFAPEPSSAAPAVTVPSESGQRPPAVVVYSLAGGAGKTCLVATLGRALSARGEQVLLADTAAGHLMPLYFGSRECRPGVVRTFSPPSFSVDSSGRGENHVPVQLLNLQTERLPRYESGEDLLLTRLAQDGRDVSRILIDVSTASRELSHLLLALKPVVLVPILPDMNSVSSVPSVESSLAGKEADSARIFYLLNQFDDSSPLHRDLRDLLQARLGKRLLPIVLRRSVEVNEALAEGMTVMDYAPKSAIADDYRSLAAWLGNLAAPAVMSGSGSRWRER